MITAHGVDPTAANNSTARRRREPRQSLWVRIRAAFARQHRHHPVVPTWFTVMLLIWISGLIAGQIWVGLMIQEFADRHVEERATLAWVWAESRLLGEESIRLSRNNCVASHTVYDLARGICDRGSGVEAKLPQLPEFLKKAPVPKKPSALK